MTGPNTAQDAALTDAAEYALGLLPDGEREAFEARLAQDRELAQDLDVWMTCFATLTETVPERQVPGALLRRIETRIHGSPPPSVWRQLLPYALGAVGGALLAWVVMLSGVLDTQPPAVRGALSGAQSFDLQYDPASRALLIGRQTGETPEGHDLELWLLPPGGQAVSLGLLGEAGVRETTLSEAQDALLAGATMAVSVEPEGGSATGAPSGVFVAMTLLLP